MIFKTLSISKIVYLAFISIVPKVIIEKLQKIQTKKKKLWQNSRPKIKHKTLYNTVDTGGLRNVNANLKVISLQCSWVKKLYDENFHELKVISLHLICITFDQNFILIFHMILNYLSFFLYFIKYRKDGVNTLLLLQSSLPVLIHFFIV